MGFGFGVWGALKLLYLSIPCPTPFKLASCFQAWGGKSEMTYVAGTHDEFRPEPRPTSSKGPGKV